MWTGHTWNRGWAVAGANWACAESPSSWKNTLTMNNSFNKKDRMCSERKTGSCDRQKKNEAKQHGGVSSPLDFCPDLCPVISVGRPFKTQHIYSEFEVMGMNSTWARHTENTMLEVSLLSRSENLSSNTQNPLGYRSGVMIACPWSHFSYVRWDAKAGEFLEATLSFFVLLLFSLLSLQSLPPRS